MVESMLLEFMIIGLLGASSQWLSWRLGLPAIAIMSVAGLLAGPAFGLINPQEDFGELYRPLLSVAIAIILFEGSLSLELKEIRGLGRTVIRFVTVGSLVRWMLGAFAAFFIAGLSWPVAFVLSALLIVTGPTVILPLLRQSKLKPRPAMILKWEGIITDPIGALLAVFAFEILRFIFSADVGISALFYFLAASLFAILLGAVFAKGMGWMLNEGHIPEFFKSPAVFTAVITCFAIADEIKSETGLLAVTVMGIAMANLNISAVQDMRNFKENISTLLVSGIFIMLTASLTREVLGQMMNWQIVAYVIAMLFIVRPLAILITTYKSELDWREKVFIGWIAPRGIVAITVASYFASLLAAGGFDGAELVPSVTFALVFVSVCLHGFTMGWFAKKLGLSLEGNPGVLFIESNPFTVALSKALKEADIPVLIVDPSERKLKRAREQNIPVKRGEILSEKTEASLDLTPYDYLVAGTDGEAYNTLVISGFLETFGRRNVYKVNTRGQRDITEDSSIPTTGGKVLFSKKWDRDDLIERIQNGETIRKEQLNERYTYHEFLNNQHENVLPLAFVKPTGELEFFTPDMKRDPEPGDTVFFLDPAA